VQRFFVVRHEEVQSTDLQRGCFQSNSANYLVPM